MMSGYELLTKSSEYSRQVLKDFEKLVGQLPEEYVELIQNYKTGYPSIGKIEDKEVITNSKYHSKDFFIESFFTIFEAYDQLIQLDSDFHLTANHRKYKLLPICTSGSSYKVYFLKLDTNEVFFLNPNQDIDTDLEIENFKLADSLAEFIRSFKYMD